MKVKIKELAKKRGVSLYWVAKQLGLVHYQPCRWSTGKAFPTPENIEKICDLFKCEIQDLLELEEIKKDV